MNGFCLKLALDFLPATSNSSNKKIKPIRTNKKISSEPHARPLNWSLTSQHHSKTIHRRSYMDLHQIVTLPICYLSILVSTPQHSCQTVNISRVLPLLIIHLLVASFGPTTMVMTYLLCDFGSPPFSSPSTKSIKTINPQNDVKNCSYFLIFSGVNTFCIYDGLL